MSIHIHLVNVTAVVMTVVLAVVLFAASGRAPVAAPSTVDGGPVALASFY